MADTLGVHIAESGITAARYDAAAGDRAEVVALGESGPATPTAVVNDAGGAVLVGDAAAGVDGARVTDPLERAGAGRIGALTAVLNHVVGRATAAAGAAPGRLAVVVPDDFDAVAREHVVSAGVAAGVADTVVVPRGVAAAQPGTVEPPVTLAAGAARAAALASAPLLTREDLGAPVAPKQPATPPPVPASGSVSVFQPEQPEPPEPTRPAPGPSGSAGPPTRAMSTGAISTGAMSTQAMSTGTMPPAGGPDTSAPPVVEALRYEPPGRRIPVAAWFAAVLVGLIAAVGGGIVLFSGGDEGDGSGVDADATSTSVATTTVAPSSTTEPPTTTEDPTATSSSTTTSTTTTSTTTTTTTTVPTPVAEPGVVTLVETGLQFDTGTVVRFDQDAEVVLEEAVAVLGDPDDDDGYQPNELCAGARTRFVRWGNLELVFTEDELDTGEGRFGEWYADGHDEPEGLVTRDGLGVGATVAFLDLLYGDALAIVQAVDGEDFGLFAVTNPGSGGVLNGVTTSIAPDGTVTQLWAGESCSRGLI